MSQICTSGKQGSQAKYLPVPTNYIFQGGSLVIEINPHIGVDIDGFVKKNKRLIHKIAGRYLNRINGTSLEYDDLFSLASIGFIKAYKKFDPVAHVNQDGKGVQFSTYAVPMMKGEIIRFFRDHDEGLNWPRSVKELAGVITRLELVEKDPEEIFNIIKGQPFAQREVTLKDIKLTLEYIFTSTPRSMEETAFADDGQDITLQETLVAATYDDDFLIYFNDFTSTLSDKAREAVELRMKDLTQSEIAEKLGVSQVQVSRILKKAGQLYAEHLEDKNKTKRPQLTPIEKAIEEVSATTDKEVVEVKTGDIKTTIDLLKQTDISYREISRLTGCSLSRISELAREHGITQTHDTKGDSSPVKYEGIRIKDETDIKAIELLENTRNTYQEIADESGASYSRVSYLGLKFRSAELRKELQKENGKKSVVSHKAKSKEPRKIVAGEYTGDRDRAVQMLAEGRKYSDITALTGVPMGSLTGLRKLYDSGKYQWQNPGRIRVSIKEEEPTMPIKDTVLVAETKTVDTPREVNATQEKVAELTAEPKRQRTVRRSFNMETEGVEVTVAEALEEIDYIRGMMRGLDSEMPVSFALKVKS